MNWYKLLIAQGFDSLKREDWMDDSDWIAAKYFSIGHDHPDGGEIEDNDLAIWVWTGPGGLIWNNKGTHGDICSGHDFCDRNYKGRYDKYQRMVSVVVPRESSHANIHYDTSDLPNRLVRDLLDEWPDIEKFEVF